MNEESNEILMNYCHSVANKTVNAKNMHGMLSVVTPIRFDLRTRILWLQFTCQR